MKIWLDDIRPAPEGWVWIKHPKDLIGYLHSDVEEISFDHDLGIFDANGKEITGYDALVVVETFVLNGLFPKPKKLSIHSANAGARKKMELAIQSIENM